MQIPSCPRCSVAMEQGFMMDHSHRSFGNPGQWISGEPERSIWFGTKTRDRRRLTVAAFRCPRCGRLEMFAPEVTS
jgi:ribosomal protein S27AE